MMQTFLETRVMKVITYVVLITFSMWILEPTAVAARTLLEESSPTAVPTAKPAPEFSRTLEEIAEDLQSLSNDTPNQGTLKQQLKVLRQTLEELDRQIQQEFADTAKYLQEKALPAEILQRHEAAVASYRADLQTVFENLTAVETSDSPTLPAKANKAWQHLQKQLHKHHAPFDPNNLPFSIPNGQVRVPKETPEELQQLLPTGVKIAADTLLPGLLEVATAPGPEYLAETPEVVMTPEIQALATRLEHQPVKIYNWVHDHISFIPTYGSIQGAALTLETKQGNAFDTASLLIALLRASGIHARYAYGTVRIPLESVMNWVGGVTKPEAAIQLLAQGGIPVIAQTQGGVIKFAKLEHVWVEAWIDFIPSRGAKHQTGDSWVPLDASFKQYRFTTGMDLPRAVPFNAQALVDHLTQTATINETEGWVSGIDQNYLQTTLQNYQTQLESYLTQTHPDATVGDVLGMQTIVPANRPVLAAGLPYQMVAKGNTFAILPQTLKTFFEFALYPNDTARVSEIPAFNFSMSLAQLAGQRLTLSFEPATAADRQVIESYLPAVPDGQTLDPSTLPTALPGYLIKLKAELKLDGDVIKSAGTFTLGQELVSRTRISKLTGGWQEGVNQPIAGEFYAFGIDGQGISEKSLETVTSRMASVKTKLEAKQFEGLTKDGLIGDLLSAAALGYFAANDVNLKILNRVGPALSYRLPSFGTFSTSLDPIYSFGIPRQVNMSGILVDMDAVVNSLWAKNNDARLTKTLGQQLGVMTSALEHRVPELFFTKEQNSGEAVSAVKALALASAQGQRIYQVTATNVNSVLPMLNISSEVKEEIRDSVAVGKTVTVSQKNITVGGWTGVGYMVLDPLTGSGAYRISGGKNGAEWIGAGLGMVFGLLGIFTNTSTIAFISLIVLAILVQSIIFIGVIMIELTLVGMEGTSSGLGFGSFFLGGIAAVLSMPAIAVAVQASAGFIAVVGILVLFMALLSTRCMVGCNS